MVAAAAATEGCDTSRVIGNGPRLSPKSLKLAAGGRLAWPIHSSAIYLLSGAQAVKEGAPLQQRLYRDRQVLTETGQRLLTETTTEPGRKTETVECVREGFASLTLLTHSTVSVFRTGFVGVSVNSLCPVSVKTWQSLCSLCLSPSRATDRLAVSERKWQFSWSHKQGRHAQRRWPQSRA